MMRRSFFRSTFALVCLTLVLALSPIQSYATTFWSDSVVPGTESFNDANVYEMGIQFQSSVAGYVTAIRFYKGSSNTGLHYGTLWSGSGTKLADIVFTNETSSGWQTATLDHPVQIQANTTYVASYFVGVGYYSYDANYFGSGYDNSPLHALSTAEGGNDVFATNSHKFPTTVSAAAGNYYVDLVFQTSVTPPSTSGSGPLLLITSTDNNFTYYLPEIVRAEGLNEFATADISNVSASTLNNYDTVVLGEMPLSTAQATMFSNWVTAGGNLIAMRPDSDLSTLLGLTSAGTTLSDAYLLVNTASSPGTGIVGQTIQFHGTADQYTTNGATAVATLYTDASTATSYPAVTTKSVGSNGGQAAAFTYDLAKSVIYTHQGNPAYEGQKRDNSGDTVIRSSDLFYPSYIDLNKVTIPQADEQQRLLANMIISMNLDKKPLPRFWYLPSMHKAVVLYAIDDHATATGTKTAFNTLLSSSPSGCSVSDWTCYRGTSWFYTSSSLTNAEVSSFYSDGFEFGVHANGCNVCSPYEYNLYLTDQLTSFQAKYTSVPAQTTHRFHQVSWSDWNTHPRIERQNSIRFDMNYYWYPPAWTGNKFGFMRGSGLPMKFGAIDGSPIDVYQQATDYTNDNELAATSANLSAAVDRALGSEGYYGIFGTHDDRRDTATLSAILSVVQAKDIPMVGAKQVLTWLDGRNGSTFSNFSWSSNKLTFDITAASGSTNMYALVPNSSSTDTLSSLTRDGTSVTINTSTIKGVSYAYFAATSGTYEAQYGTVATPTSTPTPTPKPSSSSSGSSSSNSDPNKHEHWKYGVQAGANFVGTPTFLSGFGASSDAKVFINNDASDTGVAVTIQAVSPDTLLGRLSSNPFPWMQGLNTVSDIYHFNSVSAFNGYAVQHFKKPVTIILPYDPSLLYGLPANQLLISWYDPAVGKWKLLKNDLLIDRTKHTISTTTTELTYFSVVYPVSTFKSTSVLGASNIQIKEDVETVPALIKKTTIRKRVDTPAYPAQPTSKKTCFFFICW